MTVENLIASSEILSRLQHMLKEDQHVYLVGGAVRDMLLNRPVHDFDFAVHGNACRLARKAANYLNGAFYIMDGEHDTARVILLGNDGSRAVLDFAGLRSDDLEGDLRGRDFTINAIAADLQDPTRSLIDPCNGGPDLQKKVLRACSSTSFQDDPVRVLRAVRMSLAFDLRMTPETKTWLREAAPLLEKASAERKRDELFRMLDGERVSSAIRILDQMGALQYVLPELDDLKGVEQSAPHTLDVWNHTIQSLTMLQQLLDLLVGEYQREAVDLMMGMAVNRLGRFRQGLEDHFAGRVSSERSLRSLLFFAMLYHDIAKPETKTIEENGRTRFLTHDKLGGEAAAERAEQLALSNAEVDRLRRMIQNHMRIHLLTQTGKTPSRRAQYRFFRDTGPAGVDICLMTLADTLATYGPTLKPDHWEQELDSVRTLLEAWYEHPEEIVKPQRLINGHDLQEIFAMEPGPQIGDLLESIREHQAEGLLKDREDAIQYARNWIHQKGRINGGE